MTASLSQQQPLIMKRVVDRPGIGLELADGDALRDADVHVGAALHDPTARSQLPIDRRAGDIFGMEGCVSFGGGQRGLDLSATPDFAPNSGKYTGFN